MILLGGIKLNVENITSIFRILANENRMKILNLLKQEPKRLIGISHTLQITPQETKRHLLLLQNFSLIYRDPSGRYSLSTFGKCILEYLKNFEKLYELREYFLKHKIEIDFLLLSLLEEVEVISEPLETISLTYQLMESAEESLYIHIKGIFHLISKVKMQKTIKDVRIIIYEKELEESQDLIKKIVNEFNVKVKICPSTNSNYNFLINDTKAMCFLPTLDGEVNLSQAIIGDKIFREICLRKFQEIWYRSKHIPEIVFPYLQY